jgi:hypothetical protein
MKIIFKRVFNLLIKPSEAWEEIFKLRESKVDLFLNYGFTFALIGPILSFYSLYFQEKYPIKKVLTYSLTTYILDLITVIILSLLVLLVLRIFKKTKNFDYAFKIALFIYIPIWLSDFVDIYQPLRILSNIGLIYSFFILYKGLKISFQINLKIKKDLTFFLTISGTHLLLYITNAFISELIVTNPFLKTIIQNL